MHAKNMGRNCPINLRAEQKMLANVLHEKNK